jgi:hypothetical protein
LSFSPISPPLSTTLKDDSFPHGFFSKYAELRRQ